MSPSRAALPAFLSLPLALLAAGVAHAQSPLAGDWLVTVKLNAVSAPSFPGASDSSFIAYPSLSFRRVGAPDRFSTPDEALSFGIVEAGRFRAGLSGKFVGARKASDHPALRGLRDVPWTIEAGAFAEVWPVDWLRGRVDLRRGFHGHRGLVADFALDGVLTSGDWTFSAGPRLSLADGRYMRTWFGVTPAEAAINGVATPYAPGAGLRSAGLAAAASYRLSEAWRTTLYGRWDRLAGEAGGSPIPARLGSRDQFTLGASLAYTFQTRLP